MNQVVSYYPPPTDGISTYSSAQRSQSKLSGLGNMMTAFLGKQQTFLRLIDFQKVFPFHETKTEGTRVISIK